MKRNSIYIILAFCLFSYVSIAQTVKGSGKLKTETVDYSGFKHLMLQGKFNVTLIQGDTEGLRISTDDNLIDLFQTRMEGDILYITMLADIKKYEELNLSLSVRDLQSITLLNQVSIKSLQVLHFDDIAIFSSGGSQIDCEFYATRMVLNVHDQAFTKLKGYAEILSINAHDETETNAFKLQSERCQVTTTGYSEVMIFAEKTLKLKATGESNIYYIGEPKITERIFSSAGFIVKRKSAD